MAFWSSNWLVGFVIASLTQVAFFIYNFQRKEAKSYNLLLCGHGLAGAATLFCILLTMSHGSSRGPMSLVFLIFFFLAFIASGVLLNYRKYKIEEEEEGAQSQTSTQVINAVTLFMALVSFATFYLDRSSQKETRVKCGGGHGLLLALVFVASVIVLIGFVDTEDGSTLNVVTSGGDMALLALCLFSTISLCFKPPPSNSVRYKLPSASYGSSSVVYPTSGLTVVPGPPVDAGPQVAPPNPPNGSAAAARNVKRIIPRVAVIDGNTFVETF